MIKKVRQVKRGEMYRVCFNDIVGSEQGMARPVLIVSNDDDNRCSPTVIIAAITSQLKKTRKPTHFSIPERCGLGVPSVVLAEQLRTVDKVRLRRRIGFLDDTAMKGVGRALAASLGLRT